ncbi:hypothetical protein [Micromonospora sp. DT62]|uniref:hypothetical protein n=1 Tax=Micromonospora sp. DT62 TaxID=3416521 RepID=UPI003CEF578A
MDAYLGGGGLDQSEVGKFLGGVGEGVDPPVGDAAGSCDADPDRLRDVPVAVSGSFVPSRDRVDTHVHRRLYACGYSRSVSFGTYARRVRDRSLPYGLRVSALRSCVQLYKPIGFHATLGFLEEVAGSYQRDEAALLRALDAVEASRARWHADMREYACRRRQAKHRGHRTPPTYELNPNGCPRIWYGAARPAALYALRFWSRSRLPALTATSDEIASATGAIVVAALSSNGDLATQQRRLLDVIVAELQRRMRSDLWSRDQVAYFRASDLLTVAHLVETACDNGAGSPDARVPPDAPT